MTKLIFGCGYLGERVARRWLAEGEQVFAVTRSGDRAERWAAEGLTPVIADVMRRETLVDLPAADTVLYSIGYDRRQSASQREVYVEGLRAVLGALPAATGRLIYVSSTGVYAQQGGQWVDEQSPCEPAREGGRACLEAEQLLRASPLAARSVILRLAGIYGPGRIPLVDSLRRGEPVAAPAEGFLNLIHVDDAADVVLAAAKRRDAAGVYLVSDGHPIVRRDYYEAVARQIGAAVPRFVSLPADAPAATRAESSKRIKNDRMVRELQTKLAYPTYREGLAAILGG